MRQDVSADLTKIRNGIVAQELLRCKQLTNEAALVEILKCEAVADESFEAGAITQERAWDMYFGLMHECDERGLMEHRKRLCGKIDTKKYKPFQSEDPCIRVLAFVRARMMNLGAPASANN